MSTTSSAPTSTPPTDSPITFTVRSANDKRYPFTLPPTTTIATLKQTLSSPDHADTPPDRQRLIYSGRVLRDSDTLATYSLKNGHTIHLVRSAPPKPSQPPSSSSASGTPSTTNATAGTPSVTSSASTGTNSYQQQREAAAARAAAQGVPSNIAAGPGNDPANLFTSARNAGFLQMPSAESFAPGGVYHMPTNPDEIATMLENPMMRSLFTEALSNPDTVNMMVNNPMIPEASRPGLRAMLADPNMRAMLANPEFLRASARMSAAMGGGAGGMGGFGGMGAGQTPFAAPGETSTTEPDAPASGDNAAAGAGAQQEQGGQAQGQTGQNPFGLPPFNFPGANDPAALNARMEMLRSLMGGAGAGAGGDPAAAANNPFLSLFGGGAGGLGGLGGLGGAGAGTPPPADNRPPEERYAAQLGQLNEMGFFDFERNVSALRASGGNVNGAVEWLLSHM